MHLSITQWIALVSMLAVVGVVVWIVVILARRQEYTREKFAFAALSGTSALATSILSTLADKETPWSTIANFIRAARGLAPIPSEPPRVADHVLMLLVLTVFVVFVLRLYEKWPGAISVRQSELDRFHEPSPLFVEGLVEAKRLIKRGAPLQILRREQTQSFVPTLERAQDNLAWHMQVRDLVCLRNPGYKIDSIDDWHPDQSCWIGRNLRADSQIAILCTPDEPLSGQVETFLDYAATIFGSQGERNSLREFIVAIKQGTAREERRPGGGTVHIVTEGSLLDDLVDFSDYYANLKAKVERQQLPDSSLTVSDVYTPPSFRSEDGTDEGDVEEYIRQWLAERSERHLALLGEYGQGKSTTALMTAYHLMKNAEPASRVPILIELRGKSPRNLTPEEIIAGWAYPYHIDPLAVMKLLIAGRLFLILEGFDEMALVGDSEARLDHFRTLWKFSYPLSKILISGRPNFFLDNSEMKLALGIARSMAAGPYCEAIQLEPFSLGQVEHALRAFPEKTRTEIVTLAALDPNFREVVSRGSLLYVVSQLWEREKLSERKQALTSAYVMNLFILHSYRRQTAKALNSATFMVLNEGERAYFMNGIAAYMGAKSLPNQISRDQFEKIVSELYEAIPPEVSQTMGGLPQLKSRPLRERMKEADDALQDISNDVRSSGILVVDQTKLGSLRFAHKSFLEFLMAKVYSEFVLKSDRAISGALISKTGLSAVQIMAYPECVSFLAEILLGSLAVVDPARSRARQLFELIVLQSYAKPILVGLRARLALRELESVARNSQSHKLGIAGMAFQKYASLLQRPEIIIMSLGFGPFYLVFASRVLRTQFLAHHKLLFFPYLRYSPVLLASSVLFGLSYFVAVLMMLDKRAARSAVRLWFVCCVFVGLDALEIAEVARLSYVDAIAELLHVDGVLHEDSHREMPGSGDHKGRGASEDGDGAAGDS